MKHLLSTFEGCDGCGKTTVMAEVARKLEEKGIAILATREPGGVPISEAIRKVILDPQNTSMDIRTEVLLFAASRRQHLVEKVIPALQTGKLVLSDRFVDSSLAYQGFARGAGFEAVRDINDYAIGGIWPDVTYFIDVAPEVCLQRIAAASQHEHNRLDLEKLNFHRKVYAGFQQLCQLYPQRIVRVDGTQEFETEVKQIVDDLLRRWENASD